MPEATGVRPGTLHLYREPAPGSGTGIAGAAACTPQSEVSGIFPEPDGQTGNGAVARDWIS